VVIELSDVLLVCGPSELSAAATEAQRTRAKRKTLELAAARSEAEAAQSGASTASAAAGSSAPGFARRFAERVVHNVQVCS
jgi:hypothetical protein